MNELIIGTDFSGLGSPEEALKRLNVKHRVAFACERDKHARASYSQNHNPGIFYNDITERNNAEVPNTDLYVFGFPCQAFSMAGHRKGFEDTRGTLFFNSLEYIAIHKPRVFIAENVKGLLSHDKVKGSKSKYGKTFGVIRDALALTINGQHNLYKYDDCVNYHIYFQILNTKDYGVPQNRERIFIVGFRDEIDASNFKFPKTIPLKKSLKHILEPVVNQKYYLSDKMMEYLLGRKNNFNAGKINFKGSDDIASTLQASPSLDISDNIIDEEKHLKRSRITNDTNDISPTILANKAKQSTDAVYIRESEKKEVIVVNDYGKIKEQDIFTCIDANYGKGIDNHSQRSMIMENDNPILVEHRGHKVKEPKIITDGIVPTLRAESHGYETKVVENNSILFDKENTVNLSNPNSKTRRGRVGVILQLNLNNNWGDSVKQQDRVYDENGIMACVTSSRTDCKVFTKNRIRRLTPKECFRLMGYDDIFFEKCSLVNSDTQLYKQAGNSMVVDTILHLLIQILKTLNIPYEYV